MIEERVTETIFKVGSESSSKVYVVDIDPRQPTCTCTNYAIQRNRMIGKARDAGQPESSVKYECKHIKEAQQHTHLPMAQAGKKVVDAEQKRINDEAAQIRARYQKKNAVRDLKDVLADLKSNILPGEE